MLRLTSYQTRNALLKQLGYSSYKAYLKSELWRDLSREILREWNWQCAICKEATIIVHHIDYDEDTLTGADINKLIPLCNDCHHQVEFGVNGYKRTVEEACAALRCLEQGIPLEDPRPRKWGRSGSDSAIGVALEEDLDPDDSGVPDPTCGADPTPSPSSPSHEPIAEDGASDIESDGIPDLSPYSHSHGLEEDEKGSEE